MVVEQLTAQLRALVAPTCSAAAAAAAIHCCTQRPVARRSGTHRPAPLKSYKAKHSSSRRAPEGYLGGVPGGSLPCACMRTCGKGQEEGWAGTFW